MSLMRTTDVQCDVCGNWAHGVTGTKCSAQRAREAAKSAGYYRVLVKAPVNRSLDLCPDCQKLNPEHVAKALKKS